ncbi:MAG: transcription elongation factor GreA [Bacteroidota bacterium]|nr:transcription elongation factor GreA [Bacteroidota bacterium]
MQDISYFTQEGLDKLNEELRLMKSKGRAEIARQIQEARDKGDLSENAEYDAAKDAQGMLEAKIAQLEDTLSRARVIDESNVDTSKVMILSVVDLMNHNVKKKVKYKLVSETEASFKEGKISIKSPIGQGLLGKKIGDVVEVSVPAGKLKLEILHISR